MYSAMTDGRSVRRSLVYARNLVIRIGCVLDVSRISRSDIRKMALRSIWIVK
jgi:hypothetical protein